MERSRSHSVGILVLLASLVAALASGCSDNPVGRKCFIGADASNDSQRIIASPALECQSRTCLHVPPEKAIPEGGEPADLCTASCETDEDCDKVPESPCQTGFTCAIPVVVGPFCCQKMCVCRDYLVIPDGGVPEPKACDPDIPENTCQNLPGR